MKRLTRTTLVFLGLVLVLAAGPLRPDVGPAYAIRNCRIVSMAGPPVEKGTILIRDGLIEAVGPADKVAVPEDAEVIEAGGLIAYPGLISGHTNLFLELPRPQAEQSPADFFRAAQQPQAEDPFPPGPAVRIFDQIKYRKTAMEGYHKAGFTTVLVAPFRGIFEGQSVLLDLNGDDPEAMVLRNPVALHVNFTTERRAYPSSLMGTIAHIRQSLLDARYYADRQAQYAKVLTGMKRPAYDSRLEALVPFACEGKPVVFQCNNVEDIKRALKIVSEFKLNACLAGANEAWRAAEVLKPSRVPLLVTLDFKPPSGSRYVNQGEELKKKAESEIYPANPAQLAKAGLPFALTSFGLADGPAVVKAVQAAIKAGLPLDAALRALTVEPARILGIDRQAGTLEAGKIANVVLTSGEIFGEKSRVARVFVDGAMFTYEEKSK